MVPGTGWRASMLSGKKGSGLYVSYVIAFAISGMYSHPGDVFG
jgi:hypothetical protein